MTAERYLDQVALLLRTIPEIASEPDFALKGGTAINLFVRDLPRLSVDIDLVYLQVLGDANRRPEGEWVLNYIIAHADPSKSGLPFRRSAELKRFLAIFENSTFSGARWHLDLSRIQPIFAQEWMLSLPSAAITSRFHKSDKDIVGVARPKR